MFFFFLKEFFHIEKVYSIKRTLGDNFGHNVKFYERQSERKVNCDKGYGITELLGATNGNVEGGGQRKKMAISPVQINGAGA